MYKLSYNVKRKGVNVEGCYAIYLFLIMRQHISRNFLGQFLGLMSSLIFNTSAVQLARENII